FKRKLLIFVALLLIAACNAPADITASSSSTAAPDSASASELTPTNATFVPQEERWGIYRLDIHTQELDLVFSSPTKLSFLDLNNAADRFVFSMNVGGESNVQEDIFAVGIDGRNLQNLTDNNIWDLYPAWSSDDSRISFLSQRKGSLGIYVMNADGSDQMELFDSDAHEADIDWVGDTIAFTKDSRIWIMNSDGSQGRPISDPPRVGEWGSANLPFGDYDPRISPDGSTVVFERLLDDETPHGNYDFFAIDLESSQETRLTSTGYAQGLASWSHSGEELVYIVGAIDQAGQYDIYLMSADGTNNRSITPETFPQHFLCHWAVFSSDDSAVFFIGEWWLDE
ncbi:MAG: hypothetical protein MUP44_13270, partial [Anaerolineales bacterium]|nr:hypothetical protein [Anaerolineales bacterium]